MPDAQPLTIEGPVRHWQTRPRPNPAAATPLGRRSGSRQPELAVPGGEAMGFLLDSNVLIALERERLSVEKIADGAFY
ncbi:MAG: hypothetical protein HY328_16925 [Chloroflexi bacterium]|nr:hypothetical protein [Chloroflexota bacterium]